DAPRFGFPVPSVNREEPLQRYHWVVLPQGLKNSPTICQWFMARALSPAREKHPQAIIIHYMDDLLISAPMHKEMRETCDSVITEVQNAGLEISTSKIQEVPPWKYLGWRIMEQTIKPQKIQLKANVNNLQILGEINWIRPILGITNDELAPLFNLLRGDCNINSLRTLTPEAQEALEKIVEALQHRQAHRCEMSQPFSLTVSGEKMQLYGLIFQWDTSKRDPLLIIEWIFLPYRSPKTIFTTLEMIAQIIIRARARLLTMAGRRDFATIYLPLKKGYFDWAFQKSEELQTALLNYSGVCSIHYPSHKLLQAKLSLREKSILSEVPLDAITLFTDGS
ncbi:POK25 protein, partial [Hylia prasina]|nr:POK25 protein [Hylia prasina]